MFTEINSVHNPRVKEWAKLKERKGRIAQAKFLLEGTHLVQEALQSGVQLEALLFAASRGIPRELEAWRDDERWVSVSDEVFAKCTDAVTPQAVLGIACLPAATWEAWYDSVLRVREDRLHRAVATGELVIVIEGVQDPGNLGTMIRSALAVGVDGVLLGGQCADVYAPKTVRATMGALFHVPVFTLPNISAGLRQAASDGAQLWMTATTTDVTMYAADFRGPTWLIFGNEGAGVSNVVAELTERRVAIPMEGRAESLNVAMAATVLLYEAYRQRLHA